MSENEHINVHKTTADIVYNLIIETLQNEVYRNNKSTDISDLGNEFGISLGKAIPNITEDQINDFMVGLRHGISLTNGTH